MSIFDYNPNNIAPYPYWRWNKVLPAVYDDSLSQYEILSKLLCTVNQIIESTNTTGEQVEQLTQLVQQLIDGEFPSGLVQYVREVAKAAVADDIESVNAVIASMQEQIDRAILNTDLIDNNISSAQPIIRHNCSVNMGVQGGTIVEVNDNKYIVMYVHDSVTPNNSTVNLYSMNNVLLDSVNMNCGKGNSVSSYNGSVFIASGSSNTVVKFDIKNLQLSYDTTFVFPNLTSTWGFAVDKNGDYIVTVGSTAYTFAADNLSTPAKTVKLERFESNYNGNSMDGIGYDSVHDWLLVPLSDIGVIVDCYDMSDGTLKKRLYFEDSYGYVINNEIEWVALDGTDIYFCANPNNTWAINGVIYTVMKANLVNAIGISSNSLRNNIAAYNNITIKYQPSANIVFPSMKIGATVSNVTDLIGFIYFISKNGGIATVDLLDNVDDRINLRGGSNVTFRVGNYHVPIIYAINSRVTVIADNKSTFFDEANWHDSYFIGLRNSELTVVGNPNPASQTFEPTKIFISAINSKYYLNANNLNSTSKISSQYSVNLRKPS